MSILTRLTVNLTERSDTSLTLATELTGDSKTDIVNRALQAYAWLLYRKDKGDELIVRNETGEKQIEFL